MAEKPETHFAEDTNGHDHDVGHDHASLGPVGTRGTDTEKGSSRYAASDAGLAHKSGVSQAERRLLLKLGMSLHAGSRLCGITPFTNAIDGCILPFAVLLYLSAYLDRGNLANGKHSTLVQPESPSF